MHIKSSLARRQYDNNILILSRKVKLFQVNNTPIVMYKDAGFGGCRNRNEECKKLPKIIMLLLCARSVSQRGSPTAVAMVTVNQ